MIAWVGYDDNRDLNLEGARSGLPIWTEFMMKATALYPPKDSDQMYFEAPPGIEFARVDSESLQLANPSCENTFQEAFIAGTAPISYCPLHGFRISDAVEKGVEKGVTEAGKGIGKVLQGFGKAIGGIFGGGDDKAPKQ